MEYVYVIKSTKNEKIYIGSTSDLKRRIAEHNKRKTISTKAGVPWELVYYEAHRNKLLARKSELFYKSSQGRRQLKKKLSLS